MAVYVPILLFFAALVAGFMDAIAGGGGLLTLPALLLTGQSNVAAMATNKGQSVFGSGMALLRFYHSPLLDRRRAMISFPIALVASAGGALLLHRVPKNVLQPMVILLLLAVAIFMIVYRPPTHAVVKRPARWAGPLIALVIAFYDGFFGPGTGTFLILAYVLFFADALDAASANAKVVNFGSNLGALIVFASLGQVVWQLALPMAAGQAIGGFIGAHVTIRHGKGIVRVAVIAVSLMLIAWLTWKTLM